MRTYTTFKNDLGDLIRDNTFVSDNPTKVLRALNRALSDINIGETGEDETHFVGYDFQREIQDIPFDDEITGTQTGTASSTILIDSTASFITKSISVGDDVENTTDGSITRVVSIDSATQITTSGLKDGSDNTFSVADAYKIKGVNYKIASTWNYKMPFILRLAKDHDEEFTFNEPEYFERRKFASGSDERMYTVDYQNGTRFLRINYDTVENLNFVFYSNNIVLNTDGSTRQTEIANDGDQFLIPDEHYHTIVELTAGYVFRQMNGEGSVEALTHLTEGRKKLKRMINSIGVFQKLPVKKMRPRLVWPVAINKISRN
jgi:hypothetical protein